MAMFPTVPPTSEVCCNDIFNRQARAYLSGSREGTAPPEGDAARHRVNSGGSPAPAFARRESAAARHGGLDALAEQACMGSPSSTSSSSSSTLRTPPVDRASSRSAGHAEHDGEGAISRQSRSRQSKVCGRTTSSRPLYPRTDLHHFGSTSRHTVQKEIFRIPRLTDGQIPLVLRLHTPSHRLRSLQDGLSNAHRIPDLSQVNRRTLDRTILFI